ncbi:hypothetical protein BLX24_09720 [Arsenicibacter rosenii]|uniref:Thioredoxin domain-containing protein n=2 Tax=Arsenicibacter rosenii TaxID=1750698 RepID=A0A1S2VN91_9BACT|nr:hypothetical protein BLX24_09720 [Arsenicibacter rosenii]
MSFLSKPLLLLLCFSPLFSCEQKPKTISVKGKIPGLPDGKVLLHEPFKNNIYDSTTSRNGEFAFLLSAETYPEPIPVSLRHVAADGNIRDFTYNVKMNNGSANWVYGDFMLEDGTVFSKKPVSEMKVPDGRILYMFDSTTQFGRQTQLMHKDQQTFYKTGSIARLKQKIEADPYAFHYLYTLKERIWGFSDAQFKTLFAAFDKEVQDSKTGKELLSFVETRSSKKLNHTTELFGLDGRKTPVLEKDAKYTMVILWAYWCGPCRAEIPTLKTIYTRFAGKPQVDMVSVTVDADEAKWKQALAAEKMPWKQLRITPDAELYMHELFSYTNAIPVVILVDQQGKLLKRIEGSDKKALLDMADYIAQQDV